MTPRAGFQMPTSARASDDLPDPLGPMTPSAVPAVEREARPRAARPPWLPGGATLSAVTRSDWRGAGSGTRACSAGVAGERVESRAPALPRGDEGAPVRDRELDRRERARGEDGRRDDDARARFLLDHQIRAKRQHGGLQHEAQDARRAAEAGG